MTRRSKARSRSSAPPAGPPSQAEGLQGNGWTIFAHPLFLDQVQRLVAAVDTERARHGPRAASSANAQLLAAIARLAFDVIPGDPGRKEYRQGDTLRAHRKHWFRAKFGAGRFRLFFRFRSDLRVIVYVWVNDSDTLRTYGSRTDAYAVFSRMLDSDNPSDDWDTLLAEAGSEDAIRRTSDLVKRTRGE